MLAHVLLKHTVLVLGIKGSLGITLMRTTLMTSRPKDIPRFNGWKVRAIIFVAFTITKDSSSFSLTPSRKNYLFYLFPNLDAWDMRSKLSKKKINLQIISSFLHYFNPQPNTSKTYMLKNNRHKNILSLLESAKVSNPKTSKLEVAKDSNSILEVQA